MLRTKSGDKMIVDNLGRDFAIAFIHARSAARHERMSRYLDIRLKERFVSLARRSRNWWAMRSRDERRIIGLCKEMRERNEAEFAAARPNSSPVAPVTSEKSLFRS